jgi:DNA-binding CsgD family transcriptional regulator
VVSRTVADRIEAGRAALRVGDAAGARSAVADLVDDAQAPAGDVAEILARADYLDLDYPPAIAGWERAYAAHRAAGHDLGAIRAARTLSGVYFTVVGDFAVSRGWLARAQTLLEGAADASEEGWVSLNRGMFEPDRDTKNTLYRTALDRAREAGDSALEVAALGYLGASLVHTGEAEEGMRLLDEALAAVAGDEVDDFFVVEEVFCQLFSACEHDRDVVRADQWIRVGETVAERRRLPAVAAFCRTHYGGVLTAAGRWEEADVMLTEAVGLWDLGGRSILRGGALVRLADLRVRQGRFDEASQLLTEIDANLSGEAARPLAVVHQARGETALARDVIERALGDLDPRSTDAAALVDVLVDVLITEGALDEARAAVDRLTEVADTQGGDFVRAVAASASGRLCIATERGDPVTCFREAVQRFGRARMPLEVARARLDLAGAVAVDRPEVARAEARAALEAFEGLDAARHADAAVALLRTLGVRTTTARSSEGVLTKREAEVLDLIGAGLSNPEIAERLYISRKTVEHHVSNVLAKLGLRSRSEAAGYAVRTAGAEPASD